MCKLVASRPVFTLYIRGMITLLLLSRIDCLPSGEGVHGLIECLLMVLIVLRLIGVEVHG